MSLTLPHMRWPFARDPLTRKVICVEQDTPEHARSQEWAVAMCPVDSRLERPDFGWPIPFMEPMPVDPTPLIAALDRLVPGPSRTAADYSDLANAAVRIEIDSEEPSSD